MEHKFPPHLLLFHVADHIPRLMSIYIRLWAWSNDENKIMLYFKDVKNEFFCTHIKFRNDLMKLAKEGLVEVDETPNAFFIQLIDIVDDFQCSA